MPNQSDILKQQLFKSLALPWQDILPESRIETILEEEEIRYRKRLYSPMVTLWAMVYQVLCADKSLRNTVKWLRQWLIVAGETPPSSDTGAYSKARTRLPSILLQRFIPESAEHLEQQVSEEHQWCGRRVRVFDGSTVLMSDSEAFPCSVSTTWQSAKGLWLSDSAGGGVFLPAHRSSGIGLYFAVENQRN